MYIITNINDIHMDKFFFREIVAITWHQQYVKTPKYLPFLTLASIGWYP